MTWLDLVILIPLLIGLVVGLIRGLVTEMISILAVVLGFIGAKLWGSDFSAWISHSFKWSNTICDVVAYVLLFVAIAILLTIVGKLLSKLLKAIRLGWINRLLGGLFGAAKWALIVLVILFCVDKLDQQFGFIKGDLKQQSKVYTQAVKYADEGLSVVRVEFRK